MQNSFKSLLIGLISFTLVGTVGVTPAFSISTKEGKSFGGIKPIIKKLFPPCGPGRRGKRFVVSPKHPGEVCDNKTGLFWQQKPGDAEVTGNPCTNTEDCDWFEAKAYCADLNDNGEHQKKPWRLPEVEEMAWNSLIEYSLEDQAGALNDGPFSDVQSAFYWSATEVAGATLPAWGVLFLDGRVLNISKGHHTGHAWCVRGGQDAH